MVVLVIVVVVLVVVVLLVVVVVVPKVDNRIEALTWREKGKIIDVKIKEIIDDRKIISFLGLYIFCFSTFFTATKSTNSKFHCSFFTINYPCHQNRTKIDDLIAIYHTD